LHNTRTLTLTHRAWPVGGNEEEGSIVPPVGAGVNAFIALDDRTPIHKN